MKQDNERRQTELKASLLDPNDADEDIQQLETEGESEEDEMVIPSNSQMQLRTQSILAKSYTFLKESVLPQQIASEEEAIRLSLIQKFLKYRVFPTKLILDVTQVILVIIFVSVYAAEFKAYKSNTSSALANYFLPRLVISLLVL